MTVKVKSVSKVSDDYWRVVLFIDNIARNSAATIRDARTASSESYVQQYEAVSKISTGELFSQDKLSEQLTLVKGDENTVGTEGDLAVIATQSDLIARTRRAATSKLANRKTRRLQAAYRSESHGGVLGYWLRHKTGKIQNAIKRMQG